MYAVFVLSVHVYYVNCNAKTQMGYLCALIKLKKVKLYINLADNYMNNDVQMTQKVKN